MSSTRLKSVFVTVLVALFALIAESAFATHFRYGYLYWERDMSFVSATMAKIDVTIVGGGRWTYTAWNPATSQGITPAVCPTPGNPSACCAGVVSPYAASTFTSLSCPPVGGLVNFAGGVVNGIAFIGTGPVTVVKRHGVTLTTQIVFPVNMTATNVDAIPPGAVANLPMDVMVTQVIPTQDTFYGQASFSIVMPKNNPIRMIWANSNRLSELLDYNNDVPWKLDATIDLRGDNANLTRSPKSSMSAVSTVFTGQDNIIDLPANTFDNLTPKWRLATFNESQLNSAAPAAPSVFTLDPLTGRVVFRPRINGLYAVQFRLAGVDANGVERVNVPVDVMFNAVTSTATYTNTLATTDGQDSYTATVNQPLSFTVRSTLVPPSSSLTMTVNNTILPPGATVSGGTCNGATGTCDKTFNWTPTVNSSAGSVCFTGVISNGAVLIATSTQKCVNIGINALQTQVQVEPAEGTAGGGPLQLRARLTRVLDGAPLANRQVTFTYDANPGNPPWVGNATATTDATGWATANLLTAGAVDPASTLTASFTAIAGELLASSASSSVISIKRATTSVSAPTTGNNPFPSVGYPLPISAVLNRHWTDGGVFGVGAMLDFTLTDPAATATQLSAGPTDATGVATATFPAPAATGTHTAIVHFAGNDALFGNVTSATTAINVRQRTQVTMAAGIGYQNGPSEVTAQLVAIPSNTPLANRQVTFSTTGMTSQTVMTDASGVARASFTWTTTGAKPVTATFSPAVATELNRNGIETSDSSVANINVQTASATTTTTSSVTSFIGETVTLTAHSQVTAGGAAVPNGGTIRFNVAGMPALNGTITSNGDASVSFVASTVGTVSFTANYLGVAGYAPSASASNSVTVSKVSTSLTLAGLPVIESVGNSLPVTATLSRTSAPAGALGGEVVTFTLNPDPGIGGTPVTLSTTTDAMGVAGVTFALANRGQNSVSASFAGTAALNAAGAAPAGIAVNQKTALTLAAGTAVAGAQAEFTATLTAVPSGELLSSQTVSFASGSSTAVASTVNGVANASMTFPSAGSQTATATFAAPFFETSTADVSFTIQSAASSTSNVVAIAASSVGQNVSIAATVTRTVAPMGPVGFTNVLFSITGPDGGNTQVAGQTGPDGVATGAFLASQRGLYSVTASFAGDSALESSSSAAPTVITVTQPTSMSIAPVTGNAATALTVTATLTSTQGGWGVSGQNVTFTFSGPGAPFSLDAVTDGDGVATVSPTFATGTFVSHASFAGANFFDAASASSSVIALNTPPTISDLTDINLPAISAQGRSVTFTSTANDAEQGSLTPTCTPASGFTFPIGTTVVTCSVTDNAGASATDMFSVTIYNNAPTFTAPSPIVAEATGAAGAVVSFTADGHDTEDGPIAAVCTPASGATFALGDTTVTCTVTDDANATATGSFNVNVSDTTAPVLTLPVVPAAFATSSSGNVVNFSATAVDIVDGARTVTCSPASGSTFPIATTTVNCSVSDARGNTSTGSFEVSITNTPPTIIDMPNLTGEATSPAGREFTFASSGNDAEQGALAPVCTAASGTFPIGTTSVSCTVTDMAGATATDSFTVTVVDTINPVVTYSGNAGTYSADQTINITCAATDSGSGVASTTCANITGPAHTFAVGVNTRTASATDNAGNTASTTITFTVTVPPAAVGNVITNFVDNPTEAAKMNATLNQATSAPNASARAAHLNKLKKDIEKEIGKTLTAAEAATLISLLDNLY